MSDTNVNAHGTNGITLLPCPHCGRFDTPKLEVFTRQYADSGQFQVVCRFNQGGCGAAGGVRKSEAEAIAVWNRRASGCSTCAERRGYHEDAETIQRQQERIAELEAEAAALRMQTTLQQLLRREMTEEAECMLEMIAERDALIRDLLKCVTINSYDCYGCPMTECEVLAGSDKCMLVKRAREFGIEEDS